MNKIEGFPVELCPPHCMGEPLDDLRRDIWIIGVSEIITDGGYFVKNFPPEINERVLQVRQGVEQATQFRVRTHPERLYSPSNNPHKTGWWDCNVDE